MRKLYDFRCENDHVHEYFTDKPEDGHSCPVCWNKARRIISPVRTHFPGGDDGFPGAHSKWVREHEKAGGQI